MVEVVVVYMSISFYTFISLKFTDLTGVNGLPNGYLDRFSYNFAPPCFELMRLVAGVNL